MSNAMQHLMSVVFVGLVVQAALVVAGMVCYMGNEPDPGGRVRWVLPYRYPCECTEIRLGSYSTVTPFRPFASSYFDFPSVVPTDVHAVLNHLGCNPECSFFVASGYEYIYKFAALPRSSDGAVRVNFTVRADTDVHVALTGQNADSEDMYEIVIGGWNDERSAIRREKQGQSVDKLDLESTGWLDGETYRDFWVSATPDYTPDADFGGSLTIEVGRGSDATPFLSYQDSDPLPATHVGFGMYTSSVGHFKVCGLALLSDP